MTYVIDPASPELPTRRSPRPATTTPAKGNAFPHQQISHTAPGELQEELFARAAGLPGVSVGQSLISVPGSRAFHLTDELANGPKGAFQRGHEFAHLHPTGDGSLHMTLPQAVYDEVLAKGWGEPHPISGTMLVFGPRDRAELETVWQLVIASYRFALGDWPKITGEG